MYHEIKAPKPLVLWSGFKPKPLVEGRGGFGLMIEVGNLSQTRLVKLHLEKMWYGCFFFFC